MRFSSSRWPPRSSATPGTRSGRGRTRQWLRTLRQERFLLDNLLRWGIRTRRRRLARALRALGPSTRQRSVFLLLLGGGPYTKAPSLTWPGGTLTWPDGPRQRSFCRQDALPAPNLTRPDANLAHLCTTLR